MKYDIISRGLVVAVLIGTSVALASAAPLEMRASILRDAAIRFGVLEHSYTAPKFDETLVALGQRLFREKRLSLNSDTKCQTCHLDEFSSADGIPNAVGTGGVGEGPQRAMGDGAIVPRNTLPLWGRGGSGFTTFFWDGKVAVDHGHVISQFGAAAPSDDPLVVAVHLPFVEIRELVDGDEVVVDKYVSENVDGAAKIYQALTNRLRSDVTYQAEFRTAFAIEPDDITFMHIAESIAAFIRTRFHLRPSRFIQFLNGEDTLEESEIDGGLLFFGQGHCASCHRGPYFSDFSFHAVPFPQVGFGRNGFGVDYGRFNVTHNPKDLYKFRTPPLINVVRTSPYGHAGSVYGLEEAIRAHFDPLSLIDVGAMDDLERIEFYRRLLAGASTLDQIGYLSDQDVHNLISFLKALSFVD